MGEIVTMPAAIQLHEPTTDQAESIKVELFFSATTPSGKVYFNILDTNGTVIREHEVPITGQDFTDLMAGIGTTLKTRLNAIMWADVQDNYDLVP